MPIAKVKLPDGRTVTVNVPEGATQEQIFRFVQSQQVEAPPAQLTSEQQAIKADAESRIQSLQSELQKLNEVRQNPDLLEQVFGGVEGLLAVGSSAIAAPVSGLVGLADAANPLAPEGAGAARQKQVQEALTFTPQLSGGKGALQNVAGAVESVADAGTDAVALTTAGIEGAITGDPLQSARTFKNISEQGVGESLGQGVADATGSPFLGSIARTLPEATLSALGVKQLSGAKSVKQTPSFSKLQTPTKKKLSELITEKSTSADVAGVKLSADNLVSKITDGLPRIAKDPIARKAIDLGLDPASVSMVKTSNKLEKAKFKQMLNIAEKSLKNRAFRAKNRVGDVAGKTLLDRVNAVKRINREAGSNIDKIANSALKGKTVDKAPALNKFADELNKLDIKIDGNFRRLNFVDSAIEGGVSGASSAQKILSLTLKRLNNLPEKNNALQIHKLKRFIDKQVSFDKTPTGGAGGAEGVLKNLRKELDGMLDSEFPQYKKVNDKFSETASALEALQKASGRTLNLSGSEANKALGTKLRSLTNNTATRANAMEAINDLEDVLIKNKVKFKDRILEQVIFADDLETLLKISPKTGFKKQIAEGIVDASTGSTVAAVTQTSKKLMDKLKSNTPEETIKAIRDLLED